MTNPSGSAVREGAIYVEKPPSQKRNQYTLTYRYVKPDLTTGEGIYNMDLMGDLPPGLKIRAHIEGQNMLAESLAKNSPDYRYKDIFDQKIATPSEPSMIKGWNGWWTQEQFFVDLYATDPVKFPKLYVPDSPIFPREIRGGLWQNTIMLNCNVSCLDHVFEMLELSVSKNLFIKIWYYRSSEETKRLETWTNMGDIEAPIFPNDSDVVVYCLQCEMNYVLLLIWWFASAIMAKTEPSRHFSKNREFASLMIHCRVNEYETEWMPFAGSKTIAEISYHMLAYAFALYEAVPEMITIQEQPKIKIIGLISLSQLMGENSAVMNRKVIDPSLDRNYENYYENYISHSIAYDANFQPVKKASGRHCATWELVTNPRKYNQATEPETMLMSIIRIYNEARTTWHQGGLGYEHASTREVLAHKSKIFEKEVKKHVDIQSSPEYQEQVEKNKDLANVAKLHQLKILQSDEAHKALKLTELQASIAAMNEERNEMAHKITEMENKSKLEKQSLEEILKKKDAEGKAEREALTSQINALRTLVETYQASLEKDDIEMSEEPSSSASIATRSKVDANGRAKPPTRPNKRAQQDNGGTGASSLFTTTQTTARKDHMSGTFPSMNVRPPELSPSQIADSTETPYQKPNFIDLTTTPDLLQMTNRSILNSLPGLPRKRRTELKNEILINYPKTPSDGNLTEDPPSSDSFIHQIREMDNWPESDSETTNLTLCNENGESANSSRQGSFHEEPSTQDISIVKLDTSQESISPAKFSSLPIPREKSGKQRKTEYTEILKSLKKSTPNSERKRNHEGKDLNSCSAKKRKITKSPPPIDKIIRKIKNKNGINESSPRDTATPRKPIQLPTVVKMPEVVLPKIFGKKPKEKTNKVEQGERMKPVERYQITVSPIELTRSNRNITECTTDSQATQRSKERDPKPKLKFDNEFIKLQRQFELDERSREQYMADLAEYKDLCNGSKTMKKNKDKKEENWNLFGKGKAASQKNEQLSKQIMLLGGSMGIVDQWDYALAHEHEDIPRNVDKIMQKIKDCEAQKSELSAWFAHKDHGVIKHSKKQYISALFASAFAGLTVIENIMDHRSNKRVIEYGFDTPESHKELKTFRRKMKELSKFATNGKRVLSTWQSFPILLSGLIPVPPSLKIAKLVLDNFSLEQTYGEFPATSQNKTILRYLLRKLGIETIEKRYETDVVRMVTNITGEYDKDHIPILIATKNSAKSKPQVQQNLKLIEETVLWLICINTELEPEQVNLNDLKTVRKTKQGRVILTELAKISAYEPEGLGALLDIDFVNEFFSNRINIPVTKRQENKTTEAAQGGNQSRLDILEGRIPKGPLEPDTTIPGPELFIKDVHGKQTMAINDIKARLGNKNRVSKKAEKKFKAQMKAQQTNPNNENEFAKKATTTGITNPSDQDIDLLFQTARTINENKANANEKIKILSTNPGKACSRTMREIADAEPEAHVYCLNELQIKTETILDPGTWPPDHTVYSSKASSDGMSYTAIMIKNVLKHRVTPHSAPGNCTAIDIKINETITKRIVSTYRHNNKDPPLCYYHKNWNKSKYIFVEWIREIVRRARQDKVQLVLCGDWNICLSKHRGQDDLQMVEGLKNAVKSLVNLIMGNTHFRTWASPSEIDVFFVSHSTQATCTALNLHRPPCSYDGHTGHMVSMPFEKPLTQFEVKVSTIVEKDEMFKYMVDNYETHTNRLEKSENAEKKIETSYNILNEALETCSRKIGKIAQKGAGIFMPTPKDTWKYRQAANMLADEWEKRKEDPEKEHDAKTHVLRINLIKVSVMCKKLHARDSKTRTDKIVGKVEACNPANFWDTVNQLLAEPPVRELENNVKEHMKEVLALQQKTATDPSNYRGHTFKPLHKVKLSAFKTSLHGSKQKSSILKTFKSLKHYTKGHTGISRSTIDNLPIGCFRMFIYEPITLAIQEGHYPEKWRCNRTQILPKAKGIRPLSIQEIFATIIEKLIIEQLNSFLENNNFMHTSQNGFRKNLSTSSSLATVINFIARRRSEGNYVVISALDARNAFGSPPHESVIKCLSHAFEGKALKLLSESLARDAIVANKGIFSGREKLAPLGVPQGSTTSPTIFCLYAIELINSLDPHDPATKLSIFADDCILLTAGKTLNEAIERTEECYEKVGATMKSLGLSMVPEKTAILITGKEGCHLHDKSSYPTHLTCQGNQVKIDRALTYLGTIIGEENRKLTYKYNIDAKVKKLSQTTNRARSLAGHIRRKDLQEVQRALTLGSYCHNAEVTSKWPVAEHQRAQNSYIRGLGASKERAWFLKNYENFEETTTKMKIDTLTESGHPTLFEAKISGFYGLMHRTLRESKAHDLLAEAKAGIKIIDTKSGHQIINMFNLYKTDRDLAKERYFKQEFDIEPSVQTKEFKIAHHISAAFKILLARNIISIKIILPKNLSAEAGKIMWPYCLAKEFNELPQYLRGNVINKKHKEMLKGHLKRNHKHLTQGLSCGDCIEGKTNQLPFLVKNLTRNILDTEYKANLKKAVISEQEQQTEELRIKWVLDTISPIMEESTAGEEALLYWQEQVNWETDTLVTSLQKLFAVGVTFGAGLSTRIENELRHVVEKLEDPFASTSFTITNLANGKQQYMNMYEMELWLVSKEAEGTYTVSNAHLIKPERLKRNSSRELQKVQIEQKMFSTIFPNKDVFDTYAHKHFAGNKTKMAKWLYGENIAEIFNARFIHGETKNVWAETLEKLNKMGGNPSSLNLNLNSSEKWKTCRDAFKTSPRLRNMRQMFYNEIQNTIAKQPIEKLDNFRICNTAYKICQNCGAEMHTFYALLDAMGWKACSTKDQQSIWRTIMDFAETEK
ncbi:unnamed protein product [Oikopleura dioica]|uniref:Reverse transcriptase domain-containing protein n=1 Tax=Oikopleura dioica TaxID=34765 RepID=E4YJ46_OIKDI|nr:unnamed protein product [Oikopleura dioica]